jgi:hypothetical protein
MRGGTNYINMILGTNTNVPCALRLWIHVPGTIHQSHMFWDGRVAVPAPELWQLSGHDNQDRRNLVSKLKQPVHCLGSRTQLNKRQEAGDSGPK